MDLLVGQAGLLLGLRCDAQDFRLYHKGLKMGDFELFGVPSFGSVHAGPDELGPARMDRLGQPC